MQTGLQIGSQKTLGLASTPVARAYAAPIFLLRRDLLIVLRHCYRSTCLRCLESLDIKAAAINSKKRVHSLTSERGTESLHDTKGCYKPITHFQLQNCTHSPSILQINAGSPRCTSLPKAFSAPFKPSRDGAYLEVPKTNNNS